MALRATIKRSLGQTRHLQGNASGAVEMPAPTTVEIVESEGACFLLRKDESGQCIADTWHLTVQEAMEQARFEYGVAETDWEPWAD